MADQQNVHDLLIFKHRGLAFKHEVQQPANEVQPTAQDIQQPQKQQYCVNHPWRMAYTTCERCKLPFCYVDIMEHEGKYYCLTDIDIVLKNEGALQNAQGSGGVHNSFSMLSSVLLIVNSAVLGVFSYQQIISVATTALGEGIANFILSVNQLYYAPISISLIIVFGLFAAYGVTRRSATAFGIAFMIIFASLFVVVYQYLNTAVDYFLPSGMLLVIAMMFSAYSRMSAFREVDNKVEMPAGAMNWPKAGPY